MEAFVGKPLADLKAKMIRRLKVRVGLATELEPIPL